MLAYLRGAIGLVGVIGVFGVFAVKPFFPPEWKKLTGVLALLLLGATFALILFVNKIFCGNYFPDRPDAPQPRAPLGVREQRDRLMGLLSVLCFGSVGVLAVFLVKELWSGREAILAGAIMSLILIVVFTGIRARHGARRS